MSYNHPHPQQYQNVYQQMGIPQPQSHLNYGMPIRPIVPQPLKYSASNPPTSSFPTQQRPQQIPRIQPQELQHRPLPAPAALPLSKPTIAPASSSRPLPTPGKRMTIDASWTSPAQNISTSPPKRRQSPPKFNSNSNSESNSPTKESFPSSLPTTIPKISSATITAPLAPSSPPKPPTISPAAVPSSHTSTSNSTSTDLKKPNPVWKRTIPEVPAPVWGYAAGLVADPHPKSSKQLPLQVQVQKSVGGVSDPSPTKSTGSPNKLKKKNKTSDKGGTKDEEKKVNNSGDQTFAVHGSAYGLGYSSRNGQGQRYSAYKLVGQAHQQQGHYPSSKMMGSYRSRDEEDDQETEEGTEQEEMEEEEEETGEEENVSDSAPTLSRFGHENGHRRYYSQSLVGESTQHMGKNRIHGREERYHDYYEDEDEEDTPKKRNLAHGGSKMPTRNEEKKIVLRPKVKIDPYGGYEDISPIGHGARKKVRPRSEVEDVGEHMFGTVNALRNGRKSRMVEGDCERFVRQGEIGGETMKYSHRRARSAFEEREVSILNARAKIRNRDVESEYGAEEDHLGYYEDCEEDVRTNDQRRRRGDAESMYRPQSQPTSRLATGLPRPPPMISQVERKIRGGPRSALVNGTSEEESWPRNLPRLPRTPGSRTGRFDAALSESDLDEPPPPPSIMRTPSPGVAGGYVLQKREVESQNRSRSTAFEQAQRRSVDDARDRTQGQGRVYASKMGYTSSPMPQRQQAQGPPHLSQHVRYTSPRKQPQTPAPPPTIGIESPYPVGGRDRVADMNKLERGEKGELQTKRTADVRSVPKVIVMNDPGDMVSPRHDLPTTTVSVESGSRPLPSSPRTQLVSRPQSMMITHASPLKQTSPASAPDAKERPRSHSPSSLNSNTNSNHNNIPAIQVFDSPGGYISKPDFNDDPQDGGGMMINISAPDEDQEDQNQRQTPSQRASHPNAQYPTSSTFADPHSPHLSHRAVGGNNGRRLICGGCHDPIAHGRILSAMGLQWHPLCFKCTVCNTLLEHVSSYENDGKAYCHLDYHETFAPRCFSCHTAIIDEQFISLDDPALGKRAYHTQHFFCSECGDPFLDPSIPLSSDTNGELALSGDGEFEGFTVYKGYPYCEACHVRLRLPKCKRCKKAIRDHEEAVEALGGKWCWACFVCARCSEPFEDPSFFQRGNQPYCENCFSIMLRNEI